MRAATGRAGLNNDPACIVVLGAGLKMCAGAVSVSARAAGVGWLLRSLLPRTGPPPPWSEFVRSLVGAEVSLAVMRLSYASRKMVEQLVWTTLRPRPWWLPGWLWQRLVRRLIVVRWQERTEEGP